jgi:hypothetical protein
MRQVVIKRSQPSGATGDGDASTSISVSQTNGGGSPIIATIATAELPVAPCGLGSLEFAAARFSVMGMGAVGSGVTVTGSRLVWTLGLNHDEIAVELDSTMEASGLYRTAPGNLPWTGTRFDALTLRVEMDVTIPAGQTATLSVAELVAEAIEIADFVGGAAGDAVAVGEA